MQCLAKPYAMLQYPRDPDACVLNYFLKAIRIHESALNRLLMKYVSQLGRLQSLVFTTYERALLVHSA